MIVIIMIHKLRKPEVVKSLRRALRTR